MKHICAYFLLSLFLSFVAHGATVDFTVGPTGATGVDFNSIQTAIDAAATNDPGSGHHTITVQAGTYNVDDEESFTTLSIVGDTEGEQRGSGRGWPTHLSKTLINIDSINSPLSNTFLNGLQLIGAGPDASIIDAEQADVAGRVMYIGNHGVHVSGFTLKGGKLAAGTWASLAGAALLFHGHGGVYEDLLVTENLTSGNECTHVIASSLSSGGILRGARSIFRNTEITRNVDMGGHDAGNLCAMIHLAGSKSNLVANVHCHNNTTQNADRGLNVIRLNTAPTGWNVVFGTLIEAHRWRGVTLENNSSGNYVVNCTIGGMTAQGIANTSSWSGNNGYLLNNVVIDNYSGISSGGGAEFPRLHHLYNLIDHRSFAWNAWLIDGYSTDPGDDGTNIQPDTDAGLVNAPMFIDKGVTNGTTTRIYVTSNDFYNVNAVVEVDRDDTNRTVTAKGADGKGDYIDVSPALGYSSDVDTYVEYWGFASTIVRDYRPVPGSPVVDAGGLLYRHASGFDYVDVNGNTNYNPHLDIIVDLNGYAPSDDDWVVDTDLAGNPRLQNGIIDMGAYERVLASGTLILVR